MCHPTCIEFVERVLGGEDVAGKEVLEVGSRDVNGSVRPALEALSPKSYLGVDIELGPRVDARCDVRDLVARYGVESFDLVISTELVEHVRDWRDAFWNMKSVLRPGGAIIITTRSPGFAVHGYPFDFWRYTREDMRAIFADFEQLELGDDRIAPGVFAIARKPAEWQPADLRAHALYAVATRSRIVTLSWSRDLVFRASQLAHTAYRRLQPEKMSAPIKRLVRSRASRVLRR